MGRCKGHLPLRSVRIILRGLDFCARSREDLGPGSQLRSQVLVAYNPRYLFRDIQH